MGFGVGNMCPRDQIYIALLTTIKFSFSSGESVWVGRKVKWQGEGILRGLVTGQKRFYITVYFTL